MNIADLFICADVGGTFTDCLATWQQGAGKELEQRSGCIKVLSTGLIRCKVAEVVDEGRIRIEIPDELLGGLAVDQLPENFLRSATLKRLADGVGFPVGRVAEHLAAESIVVIEPESTSSSSLGEIRPGDLVEIDSRLEAPVLATHLMIGVPVDQRLPPLCVRLGTTRGTNALLTRTGATVALVVTEGFGDVLSIGEQDRGDLFDLAYRKATPLAENTIEISGRMDADGAEMTAINASEVLEALERMRRTGVDTLAICLMHAHLNPEHELKVERLALQAGFNEVSRSSEVAPLIKLVSRAETTTLDAYLNPILNAYVMRVRRQFGGERCELLLMTSGGNLVPDSEFRGRDSVLSGPAGGVVALQDIARRHRVDDAIGLDMGGTSTDVSRYDGGVARRYETRLADLRVMTPMMDIHTVAAGGGSICDFSGGRLVVGPSSAGAEPGPACYGSGGPLTVTDINVLLGRICIERFPFPLVPAAAQERLKHVASRMPSPPESLESLAEGFLEIAVTHMAEAVRAITTARGVDVRDHVLVGFGGAAAQHICRVADALGVRRIIDHPHASVLSAVGMGVAATGRIESVGVYRALDELSDDALSQRIEQAKGLSVSSDRSAMPDVGSQLRVECDCRYVGTEAAIAIPVDGISSSLKDTLAVRFHVEHERRYGYRRDERAIEVVSVRCESTRVDPGRTRSLFAAGKASPPSLFHETEASVTQESDCALQDPIQAEVMSCYCGGRFVSFQLIDRDGLLPGEKIPPGSIVASDQSTLIIEPHWQGCVAEDGAIELTPAGEPHPSREHSESETQVDQAVQMEIVARRLQSIADAMGEVLRRTAISVNVKERLDFSCAVFNREGTLVANAPHVPVHLGAMGHTVRHLAALFPEMSEGDSYVSNDPYHGGSHLPDVTLVTPVFCRPDGNRGKPDFYVASRAHHAEIGGSTPGSMPPAARHLAEEGVLIHGHALVKDGVSNESELEQLLSSGPYPSRNVAENLADLRAQVAAGRHGARALNEMTEEFGLDHVQQMSSRLLDVAAESVSRWIEGLPEGKVDFSDTLDDGTMIAVSLERRGSRLVVDFGGTAGVHPNGYNATPSIVHSAVMYVMRCFCDSNLPLCGGALRPVELKLPEGLLSPPADEDPARCPAVVAGNVETSQRIVDVLLGAIGRFDGDQPGFRSVAASQGTMNNVLMGDETFGYYETIAGGSGATVFGSGADGIHTHMTNTRITDPEVLESRLPIRLIRFAIRPDSGGLGKLRGGCGLIREFEFLRPLTVSLITSRRTTAPYGVGGGQPGAAGKNLLIRADGREVSLESATTLQVSVGDRLRIETPGGGGWGSVGRPGEESG